MLPVLKKHTFAWIHALYCNDGPSLLIVQRYLTHQRLHDDRRIDSDTETLDEAGDRVQILRYQHDQEAFTNRSRRK